MGRRAGWPGPVALLMYLTSNQEGRRRGAWIGATALPWVLGALGCCRSADAPPPPPPAPIPVVAAVPEQGGVILYAKLNTLPGDPLPEPAVYLIDPASGALSR